MILGFRHRRKDSNALNAFKKTRIFREGWVFSSLVGMTVKRGCSCPFMKYLAWCSWPFFARILEREICQRSNCPSPTAAQVLLIFQAILQSLHDSAPYVQTAYPTGNIRLIISSPCHDPAQCNNLLS